MQLNMILIIFNYDGNWSNLLYIYKIGRDKYFSCSDYDTYENAVVVANDKKQASEMHPSDNNAEWDYEYWCKSWVDKPEDVYVEYVGDYKGNEKKPFVLSASFDAG